jgi:hypothetical protein
MCPENKGAAIIVVPCFFGIIKTSNTIKNKLIPKVTFSGIVT